MSLQQLKAEAATLSAQERKELIGYLLSLGRQRSVDYWDHLDAKIKDNDPSRWVGDEALDEALGLVRSDK